MKRFKLTFIISCMIITCTALCAAINPIRLNASNIPSIPTVDSVQSIQETFGSEVIFHDDFEDGLTMAQKYNDYNSANGACVITSMTGFGGSTKSVRAHWVQGQGDAGSFAYMFGRNPAGSQKYSSMDFRDIYWRFYMKTSQGWFGNPRKLTRATILAGSNWSQAMIAHLWGEGDNLLEIDPATGIDFNNNLVTTGYNDFSHLKWLGLRKGITPVYETTRSNSWQCIEAHVKLNTPGNSDGVFEFWADGNLEVRRADLNWVGTWQTYGINTVLFENYWNEGAPKVEDRYIDNIVISTQPIGLALSPVNPYIYKSAFESPDSGVTQSVFYAQVSTSQDLNNLVWSGSISGSNDSLLVNKDYGTFQGALTGKTALDYSKTYYVRVSQVDNRGLASGWSAWKIFKTISATIDSTPPAKPSGVSIQIIP